MLSNFLLAVIAILLFLVTCIIVYLFVDATNLEIFKRKKSRGNRPVFNGVPLRYFAFMPLYDLVSARLTWHRNENRYRHSVRKGF